MVQQPVTAALIKELRDRTGVGMGKCKEALEAARGDMDLAITNLRKAGIASAVKKEGRTTNEGMIGLADTPQAVGLIEVNAETDFVVKNDKFQHFVARLAEQIAKSLPANLESFLQEKYSADSHGLTVDQFRSTLVQSIGENIQIRRLKTLKKSVDKSIGVYSHLGGKIVTAVEISGSTDAEALAKEIAMHVAAASPEFLFPEDVPANVLAQERDIAQSQIKGKPANIVEKIVDGKLNAFYDTNCLSRQKFIKNDQITIADLVNQKSKEIGKPLKLSSFIRWSVSQG